jgi:ABC-type multidrug transport system fused ATPase/permease subunit
MFLLVPAVSILASFEPLFFGAIIKKLEEFYSIGWFDIKGIFTIVFFWLSFVIVTLIFKYCVWQLITTDTLLIDYKINIQKYCGRTLDMSMNTYLWKKIGSIYKMIDRWTENRLVFGFAFFEKYLFSATQIIFVTIILFFIHVKMALISLSLLPVMIILGYYFWTVTSERQKNLSIEWERIFTVVWNGMSSFWLYKTLWLRDNFLKEVHSRSEQTYIDQMRLNRSWNFSEIYTVMLIMFSRILVLIAWLYYINIWEISLAELFVIFSYIWWIYFPLWFLFWELKNSVKHLTEFKRMHDELWNMDIEEDINTWKTLKNPYWNITFENVNFWYSDDRLILKNINFDIGAGEKIALVGNTGAGKSTIVNLLLRFWDIEAGNIKLEGTDIRELKKSSLRSHIGVVSQDNSLFNLSIEENLKFANPKATKKDIEQALKDAEAGFVFDLKDGIKTVIWERGLKLSGGEKQRISIARLFLKNPEILILDEATSALDNITEMKIEKALKKLMKWKTSIIIAHRLSTIMHVDRIFVLENGRVAEQGNYEDLMSKKKKFYNLANPDKLILW